MLYIKDYCCLALTKLKQLESCLEKKSFLITCLERNLCTKCQLSRLLGCGTKEIRVLDQLKVEFFLFFLNATVRHKMNFLYLNKKYKYFL